MYNYVNIEEILLVHKHVVFPIDSLTKGFWSIRLKPLLLLIHPYLSDNNIPRRHEIFSKPEVVIIPSPSPALSFAGIIFYENLPLLVLLCIAHVLYIHRDSVVHSSFLPDRLLLVIKRLFFLRSTLISYAKERLKVMS